MVSLKILTPEKKINSHPNQRSHDGIILTLDTFLMARYGVIKKCQFALKWNVSFHLMPLPNYQPKVFTAAAFHDENCYQYKPLQINV
jgi:hypothetical protein